MADVSFLSALLPPDRISVATSDLDRHARDWGTLDHEATHPDVVVWPETTDEVSAILAAANERGVPVTPFAAGTGIEGNAVPANGGISLDVTRMDDVLEVRPDDRQADVEPGVLGSDVDDAAGRYGLFFPPLPTSGDMATVGGMIATNASGKQTVKYGKVGDWVRELEVVLADGSVVTAGTKATKSSSGYNLRDLVVGSEGTLGVVTRATLQLAGRPEQIRAGRAVFDTLDDATAAITDLVRSGVDLAAVELIDSLSAEMVNAYVGSELPDSPTVFLEFHANHGVDEEVGFATHILREYDPLVLDIGDESAADDIWEARRELADATRAYYPDLDSEHAGDVAVPISAYPDLIAHIHAVSDEYDVPIPTFGHAGDGNVHFDVFVDLSDEAARRRGDAAYEDIVEGALELGGTATGEHGVGLGKTEFMRLEHGETGLAAMRAIKDALDPEGILNPGKIFPE